MSGVSKPSVAADRPVLLQFDDNSLLAPLYGAHDQHLARLEAQLGVRLAARGNQVSITGTDYAVHAAELVLTALYERLRKGLEVGDGEIDAAVRMVLQAPDGAGDGAGDGAAAAVAGIHAEELTITTPKRRLSPRSPNQTVYMEALRSRELVFAIGPAGTGKTYLAVAMAVALMMKGGIDRIILSRPAVEAGERLGFLPGDLREKVDPYLRPLYDALFDMLPAEQVTDRLSSGEIEVAPLAFMRGRTLRNAFVILDEAQNTTPVQMKMFLTRLGENSRMVITGDPSQVDLPKGQPSGLSDAVDLLSGMDPVALVRFTNTDVMRHSLVTRIVSAYEARDRAENSDREPGGPARGKSPA